MTNDEIHDICQQAEWLANRGDHVDVAVMVKEAVRLAVEREREACAKVCESMRPSEQEYDQRFYTACTLCAEAIRARGE
jgi:hypothetical protein